MISNGVHGQGYDAPCRSEPMHDIPKRISSSSPSRIVPSQISLARVPTEILREIFLHFVRGGNTPEASFHNVCYSMYSDADPRTLELVCKLWRNTTQTYSRLWASLFISNPLQKDLDNARVWLSKSSGHPLSLYLHQSSLTNTNDRSGSSRSSPTVAQKMLTLFIEHFHCWQHIDLHVHDGTNFSNALTPFPSTPPPFLRRASLEFRFQPESLLNNLWQVLHASPSLCDVSWYESYTRHPDFFAHVPWTQLKHISLHSDISLDGLFDIISLSAQLESLSIDRLVSEAAPRPVLVHSRLRTLFIRTSIIPTAPLFDNLTLPSLEHLSIGQISPPSPSRGGLAFANFLLRSECALKTLALRDPEMTQNQLHEYLPFPLLHSLSELSILGVECISDKTVELLTREPPPTPLPLEPPTENPTEESAESPAERAKVSTVLPMLTVLALETCQTSASTLSDMIESRLFPYPGVATLRSIILEIRNGRGDEIRRLQSLGISSGEELQMIICNVCHDPLP